MPDKSYPEGVTEMDHVNHDMKMGRFPNQSSVETFLQEREVLAAQEQVARLPALDGAAGWRPIRWRGPTKGEAFQASGTGTPAS